MIKKHFVGTIILTAFISSLFNLHSANACASGCGVLSVGTSSLIPSGEGGIAFLQYDQINQTRNWEGEHKSSGHNHDKKIATQTITAGAQYMFNRNWGGAIRVPQITRYVENLPHHGDLTRTKHKDIGDIRVNAIYSGFFDDMSTGIIFGLKLPTGATNDARLVRNTQIGTGSTDSIFGAYTKGAFGKKSNMGYFAQGTWERAFIRHQGYTPGYEISGATGIYYSLNQVGAANKVAPILQFVGAKKGQDSGWADPEHNINSGYSAIFFSPAVEIAIDQFKFYADIEFPVYRQVNGNQLVPQNIYKIILGYSF